MVCGVAAAWLDFIISFRILMSSSCFIFRELVPYRFIPAMHAFHRCVFVLDRSSSWEPFRLFCLTARGELKITRDGRRKAVFLITVRIAALDRTTHISILLF